MPRRSWPRSRSSSRARERHRPPDRILATILFGDLVGSTALLSEIGDARYRQLVELFLAQVRTELHRYRGREVDTAGQRVLLPCSTDLRERSGARRRWPLPPDASAWRFVSACTPEKSKSWATSSPASRSTSVPGSGALAEGNEILVSSTVRDIVAGSGLRFLDRGPRALKGVDGDWRLERDSAGALAVLRLMTSPAGSHRRRRAWRGGSGCRDRNDEPRDQFTFVADAPGDIDFEARGLEGKGRETAGRPSRQPA